MRRPGLPRADAGDLALRDRGLSSQGGYISHTQYEFGSLLEYIEENWNLPSLGTTDERATSIDDTSSTTAKRRANSRRSHRSTRPKYFIDDRTRRNMATPNNARHPERSGMSS